MAQTLLALFGGVCLVVLAIGGSLAALVAHNERQLLS